MVENPLLFSHPLVVWGYTYNSVIYITQYRKCHIKAFHSTKTLRRRWVEWRGSEGTNEARAVEWVARGAKSEENDREVQRVEEVSRKHLTTER